MLDLDNRFPKYFVVIGSLFSLSHIKPEPWISFMTIICNAIFRSTVYKCIPCVCVLLFSVDLWKEPYDEYILKSAHMIYVYVVLNTSECSSIVCNVVVWIFEVKHLS